MKQQPHTPPDMSYIRHQISTILTVERGIQDSLPSDSSTAQTLSNDNIQKLKDLLQYIDDSSEDREVV